MGKVVFVLPDELERKFRMRIVERYGGKKGALSKAVSEAIKLWLRQT